MLRLNEKRIAQTQRGAHCSDSNMEPSVWKTIGMFLASFHSWGFESGPLRSQCKDLNLGRSDPNAKILIRAPLRYQCKDLNSDHSDPNAKI